MAPNGVHWYTFDMPSKDDAAAYTQTAIRIPSGWVYDLKEIAGRLSRPGIPVTMADAMRAAIAEGIAKLRADLNITRTPGTSDTAEAIAEGIHETKRTAKPKRGK